MNIHLSIKNPNSVFLAGLLAIVESIEQDKAENETDTFIERFADFETPDLEYIMERAKSVLDTRAGIDDEWPTLPPDTTSPRYFRCFPINETPQPPVFRFFQDRDGNEWAIPINGERGAMRPKGSDVLESSVSKIHNFLTPSGEVLPAYSEFWPEQPARAMVRETIVDKGPIYFGEKPPLLPIQTVSKSEFAALLARGIHYATGATVPDSVGVNGWIAECESFLARHNIKPATLHVPGVQEIPDNDVFGHPVRPLPIEPIPSKFSGPVDIRNENGTKLVSMNVEFGSSNTYQGETTVNFHDESGVLVGRILGGVKIGTVPDHTNVFRDQPHGLDGAEVDLAKPIAGNGASMADAEI